MKTLRSTLTTLASLSALAGSLAHGQEAPPSPLALPAPPPVHVTGFSTPTHALAAVPHLAQAQVAHEAIAVAPAPPHWPNAPVAWTGDQDGILVDLLGTHRPRTLVIRTGESDPKASSSLEEDMSIMSRILAKAANEKSGDDDAVTAMGMKLKALTVSGIRRCKPLSGATALCFSLGRFPLVARRTSQGRDAQGAGQFGLEETRRELFGTKNTPPAWKTSFQLQEIPRGLRRQKVAKLKSPWLKR